MREQYKQFYTKYKDKLFSYLLYKCGNREVALDVMQDSFVRHLQHYGDAAVASPALLFTIARNALVDTQRRQDRFWNIDNIVPIKARDAEENLLQKEESELVLEAMGNLPEQDREMLVLAVGGVSYKEIARMFDVSLANVKVRIHRARVYLREELKKG